jgi:hypothetical protein
MFALVQKIDKAAESKIKCTLIDKTGKYYHGVIEDTWVRLSGGKLRGKVVFLSEEKGSFPIDVHDIHDILLP